MNIAGIMPHNARYVAVAFSEAIDASVETLTEPSATLERSYFIGRLNLA